MRKAAAASLFVVVLVLAFSVFAPSGMAQTATSGTVIGTVTDPSGAAVSNAEVILKNKGTNNQAVQNTNAAGQYTFVNVTPGQYEISVKKDGFRTATVSDLALSVCSMCLSTLIHNAHERRVISNAINSLWTTFRRSPGITG